MTIYTYPLVKIVSGDSYALIREDEFDPQKHDLYENDAETEETEETFDPRNASTAEVLDYARRLAFPAEQLPLLIQLEEAGRARAGLLRNLRVLLEGAVPPPVEEING